MPTATIFSLSLLLFLTLPFAYPNTPQSQNEIRALISFKKNLHDPRGALDGWDESTPSAPCDWRGVSCYSDRVYELRLPRLQLTGSLTESLGQLHQLRKLSLHSNNLNGSIPSSLSQCALLRAVYLQDNSLAGNIPHGLFNLTNLQVLNVAQNLLTGKLPGDISPSMRILDLSSNSFSGELPANFSVKSKVQLINFSFNEFSGQIPASFGGLTELRYLWLDSNNLYGTLPSAIANSSSLVHLSAESNILEGLVPETIGLMPEVQIVSLSRNRLFGSIPVSLLCNRVSVNSTSIRIVRLGFNNFTSISKLQNAICVSSLEELELKENGIRGLFPNWITNISTLRLIDFSGNMFSGGLPSDIGNLVKLVELRLANNTLSGVIPSEITKCSLLNVVDLEGNQFSGPIPEFLSELKSLKVVSVGGNRFTGTIPRSFGNLSGLETLDLSNNGLSGVMPAEIMKLGNLTTLNLSGNKFFGKLPTNIGDLRNLLILNLSRCGFSGSIPGSIGSLMLLTTLDLSRQKISGELPVELFGLPNLQLVALEENMLSGDVPEGFSSLVSLRFVNLSSNTFNGVVPSTYGFLRSLKALSMSGNDISGSIPEELGKCTNLEVLELSMNHLTGGIPGNFSSLSHLKRIDLGHNNLTGEIPQELSKCSSLTTLILDSNHITGHIPDSLSKLSNLRVLNLSSNNLTGTIPANLSDIPGLVYLNLSNNNLEGEIPTALGSRFGDPSVFAMNGKLCGKPLSKECPRVRSRKRRKLILLICLVVSGSLLLVSCCCGYVYSLLQWRKKLRGAAGEKKRSPRTSSGSQRGRGSGDNGEPKLVMFNNKITYAETLEATRQFDEENVLSRGRYGLVFKASFQDGMVLAIRRLTNGSINERTFRKEAESLGKVKHRNLTVLRGYYAAPPDARLLVYDYMPNGNLATLLQEASHRGDGHVLNWPMRHLIALGIARGLAFLHSLALVHGDVKPQNVLFDADFESHLSEFGLDTLVTSTAAEASSSSTPVGTLGYVSPEATLTGQSTKESDVYSFGIVLLEILTGKKPIMFNQDEDIVKWVKKQLQKGQISELIEPGLLELDPESSEWEEFLLGVKVGLLCTAPDPIDRPSMADVVFMLEGCRVGPDFPSSADPTSLPSPV